MSERACENSARHQAAETLTFLLTCIAKRISSSPSEAPMNQRISIGVFAAILLAAMLCEAAPAAAATSCEKLASLALPNARIDSAQMVAAGAFVPPAGPGAPRGG